MTTLTFDELHKYRAWRRFLKGAYDGRPEGQRILVTRSARLDFYRHGGHSLQGRYHLLRLHPFWLLSLRRRSQKTRLTWERMRRLARRYPPPVRITHPYPNMRLRLTT